MTFFSAIPVPETHIGIATEVTRGTPVAPEFWLPISGPKYKPDRQYLPDAGLRGSMVTLYDEVPGLRYDSHAWDAHPYLDSLPVFLRALLGSKDTKTTAPASTKLVKAAKVGDTKILALAEIAEGSYIVIGTGAGSIETHLTGKPKEVKVGEFEIPLIFPLIFAHANEATVTGLTKHAFSLLNNSVTTGNQPPSMTLTDFAGEESWRQLTAAQLNTLNIKGAADSLPTVSMDWFCNPAIKPEAPEPSYSTAEAPAGWTVQASIGGVAVPYLVNWEFDMKRNVKNVPAITGTESYYQHFAGALEAISKMTFLEDPASTQLTNYQNGETLAVDLTLSDVASGFAVNLHSTKAKYITGDLDRSKEWVEAILELQLIPSATDALAGGVSPIIATVANAHTAEY